MFLVLVTLLSTLMTEAQAGLEIEISFLAGTNMRGHIREQHVN